MFVMFHWQEITFKTSCGWLKITSKIVGSLVASDSWLNSPAMRCHNSAPFSESVKETFPQETWSFRFYIKYSKHFHSIELLMTNSNFTSFFVGIVSFKCKRNMVSGSINISRIKRLRSWRFFMFRKVTSGRKISFHASSLTAPRCVINHSRQKRWRCGQYKKIKTLSLS